MNCIIDRKALCWCAMLLALLLTCWVPIQCAYAPLKHPRLQLSPTSKILVSKHVQTFVQTLMRNFQNPGLNTSVPFALQPLLAANVHKRVLKQDEFVTTLEHLAMQHKLKEYLDGSNNDLALLLFSDPSKQPNYFEMLQRIYDVCGQLATLQPKISAEQDLFRNNELKLSALVAQRKTIRNDPLFQNKRTLFDTWLERSLKSSFPTDKERDDLQTLQAELKSFDDSLALIEDQISKLENHTYRNYTKEWAALSKELAIQIINLATYKYRHKIPANALPVKSTGVPIAKRHSKKRSTRCCLMGHPIVYSLIFLGIPALIFTVAVISLWIEARRPKPDIK